MKAHRILFTVTLIAMSTNAYTDIVDNSAFIDSDAGKCAVVNDQGQMVYTNNARMVSTRDPLTYATHLKCSFETSPTVSGKSWNKEGFMCATFNPDVGIMFTYDSHVRQTPKGKLDLTCHFEM